MYLKPNDINEIVEDQPSHVPAHYPLAMTCVGQLMRVICFSSGDKMQKRLQDMGIHVGSEIKVLKNDLDAPLLLAVGDTRIAIGQGMAYKILVAPSH